MGKPLRGGKAPFLLRLAVLWPASCSASLALDDDEIAINQWLAEDIGASIGDTLALTYFLPDEGDRLIEATATLTVARIVPLEGVYADRTLTPDFPGLAEADQLSRWDAGPAIDRGDGAVQLYRDVWVRRERGQHCTVSRGCAADWASAYPVAY